MADMPQQFIQRHTEEVQPLERETGLAFWKASLSGKQEDFARVAELEKQILAIYSRSAEYEMVRDFHADLASMADPLAARQVELLYRAYRAAQGDRALLEKIVDLETDLARQFNTFRATFRGNPESNNHLEEILRQTRDSAEAREAWEAMKQIGRIAEPRVVELVRLRNQHAQNLGSPDYYTFSLELKELDLNRLFALLKDLEEQTNPLFRQLQDELGAQLAAEFGIAPSDLRPWHYRNPFFQDIPAMDGLDLDPLFAEKNLEELTRAYYEGLGLDIRGILARSDLYEREGKDQHAYCIGIENPGDVRVLCNIKPTARWMSTMLHEFGHAVYDAGVDPALPYLLRHPAHTLTTEAIAMLNERFMRTSDFYHEIVGIPRAEADEIEAKIRRQQQRKLLVFTRWVLVMTHFERAMYADPDQDLNRLWWELVQRFQWLQGGERLAEPDWASKNHLANAPVYYQNYLLGEMNASQILASLRKDIGPGAKIINNPQVGRFLTDRIFRPGATQPWNRRLAEATGERLKPKYFLEDLRQTV